MRHPYSLLILLLLLGCDPSETVNAALNRPDPLGPNAFREGTHLIGTDINPGRYFSTPSEGCYYERLSGFGGDLSDIIANEFISFDAGQWIVDIAETDLAFRSDAECGTWTKVPRSASPGLINPGAWLVPEQVSPGIYQTSTSPGCYWQRLEGFDGTLYSIAANDFMSSGGRAFVEIHAQDAGFSSDKECGTWEKTDVSGKYLTDPMTREEILANLASELGNAQIDGSENTGMARDEMQAIYKDVKKMLGR